MKKTVLSSIHQLHAANAKIYPKPRSQLTQMKSLTKTECYFRMQGHYGMKGDSSMEAKIESK